jgi:uncharacterized membrane-anchored protein YitT (DUF2179 family)
MSNVSPQHSPGVYPRPGVLKTLGILNIVFAVLGAFCIGTSALVMFAVLRTPAPEPVKEEIKIQEVKVPGPGTPIVASFDPFTGMRDKNFIRFSIVDNVVGLIFGGLMFATGIGMINLKRWGARGWGYLAWVRIVSVVVIWGYFIVGVVPGYSEAMARNILSQMASQGAPANRLPPVAFLSQIYSITFLVGAIMAMLITSIYPAISIWLLSRPGVKAAIIDQRPFLEHELP